MSTALLVGPPSHCNGLTIATPLLQPSRGEMLINVWLATLTKNTRRSYENGIQDFCLFVKAPSMLSAIESLLGADRLVAASIIAAWRTDILERRGLAPTTLNNRLAALRSLLQKAFEVGLIDGIIPIKDCKVKPYRDTRGPGLKTFQKMFTKAERVWPKDLRYRNLAILRLLFDLGLRASEVVSLDLNNVDFVSSRLWVLGKGHLQREPMSLPKATAESIISWLEHRGQKPGALFTILSNHKRGYRINRQTVFRLVRELGQGEGIFTSPHKIRHTSITEVCKTEDIVTSQKFARHANLQTTMIYLDHLQDIDGKAAEKLSRRLKTREEVERRSATEAARQREKRHNKKKSGQAENDVLPEPIITTKSEAADTDAAA